MTLPLALSPAAEDDLQGAAAWYDAQQPGLGDAFLRSVAASFARIRRLPGSFPADESGIRSARLRRPFLGRWTRHGLLLEGNATIPHPAGRTRCARWPSSSREPGEGERR